MANTAAAGGVNLMTDAAGIDDGSVAASGANMMAGTAGTDDGTIATGDAGNANTVTNTAGSDDGIIAMGGKMVSKICDLMKDFGLGLDMSPIETYISNFTRSSRNTGTDPVNDDGSLDVPAFHAADLEGINPANTQIKPGAHAARLLQPRRHLDNYDISESIKGNLRRMNIKSLTPLQANFVENHIGEMTRVVILNDIVCIAETGAGKILSYGIPLVELVRARPHIRKMPIRRQMAEPLAIILAPTHELAIEIHATLLDLCSTEKIRCVAVYGEGPVEEQRKKLSEGCDILVATPRRLLGFLPKSTWIVGREPLLSLSRLRVMVYDEADALLSVDGKERSFKDDIDAIEEILPKDRHEDLHVHHWFFSSQYSPEELNRAESFISPSLEVVGYEFIDFDRPDEKHSAEHDVGALAGPKA